MGNMKCGRREHSPHEPDDTRQTSGFASPDLERVLDVVYDFDEFGGASLGLVAWELGVAEADVEPGWEQAIRRGLLAPAGVDELHHEQMWRLSQRARRVVPVPPAHVDVYRLATPEEVRSSEHAGLLPPEIEDPVE